MEILLNTKKGNTKMKPSYFPETQIKIMSVSLAKGKALVKKEIIR